MVQVTIVSATFDPGARSDYTSRMATPKPITTNTLYFGDNLDILRQHIADESVDLIYLDPLFNSNRSMPQKLV